jgi:tetratricopeptide (TPR) repeat protein
MAPEQLRAFRNRCGAKSVGAGADLYALGLILHELLAGKPAFPFRNEKPVEAAIDRMLADRETPADSVRKHNPGVAPAVAAIVLKLLEADPKRRYRTAAQLKEDLDRHAANLPLKHAANPSTVELADKFRRRHPLLCSATTAITLVLLVSGTLGGMLWSRGRELRRHEAKATLARFVDAKTDAAALLQARGSDHLREGLEQGRAALASFGVDGPDWWKRGFAAALEGPEAGRLRMEAGELLLMLARAESTLAPVEPSADRSAALERSLSLGRQAEVTFAGEAPGSLPEQLAQTLREMGRSAEAESLLAGARTHATTARDHFLKAFQLAGLGHYRGALEELQLAERKEPSNLNVAFLKGICLDRLGRPAEAAAEYRVCIALKPEFAWPWFNRGLARMHVGLMEAATLDLSRFLELMPNQADALYQRAIAWNELGKSDLARNDLDALESAGRADAKVLFLRSRLHREAKRDDLADADFRRAMAIEPTRESDWVARGVAWLPAEPSKALADFDRALAVNPQSLGALQNRAHTLSKYLKRPDEAIAALSRAVELYPDDWRPIAGRGVLLARAGQRDKALRDAEAALRLDREPLNAYQVAGIYALTSKVVTGDRHEALRLLGDALRRGAGHDYLDIDHDLDPIRSLPEFQKLAAAVKAVREAGRPGDGATASRN